jgi:hypothetical protein
MNVKVNAREGPREIEDPRLKKKLLRAMIKSLKEHEACKKDIKKLIYRFYQFYPSSSKEGISWTRNILPEEDIDSFVKQGLFVKSKDGTMIGLGPTGLTLISMWNTEKLTRWVIFLTILTLSLGVSSLILSLSVA